MPRKSKDMMKSICQFQMLHENIRWSNAIVDAPVVYSLLERRTLYFLTGEVKHKYTEKNLGVPENWKELYFHLTDKDLGVIGGKNNVLHTYEALSELGKKFIPVSFRNEKGQLITGKVHWVDSFFYNEQTGLYDVRVSPEIMPYLIDISKSFTTFGLGQPCCSDRNILRRCMSFAVSSVVISVSVARQRKMLAISSRNGCCLYR